jgi:hypothetical protein
MGESFTNGLEKLPMADEQHGDSSENSYPPETIFDLYGKGQAHEGVLSNGAEKAGAAKNEIGKELDNEAATETTVAGTPPKASAVLGAGDSRDESDEDHAQVAATSVPHATADRDGQSAVATSAELKGAAEAESDGAAHWGGPGMAGTAAGDSAAAAVSAVPHPAAAAQGGGLAAANRAAHGPGGGGEGRDADVAERAGGGADARGRTAARSMPADGAAAGKAASGGGGAAAAPRRPALRSQSPGCLRRGGSSGGEAEGPRRASVCWGDDDVRLFRREEAPQRASSFAKRRPQRASSGPERRPARRARSLRRTHARAAARLRVPPPRPAMPLPHPRDPPPSNPSRKPVSWREGGGGLRQGRAERRGPSRPGPARVVP